MEDVAAEPLCPFVERGCVRLKWLATENASGVRLRLVPVAHVQRLAFFVPDFSDLAARRGVDAEVPAMDSALQDRLEMRFFLNIFFPWEVKLNVWCLLFFVRPDQTIRCPSHECRHKAHLLTRQVHDATVSVGRAAGPVRWPRTSRPPLPFSSPPLRQRSTDTRAESGH